MRFIKMEVVKFAHDAGWAFLLILLVVKHVLKWLNIRQRKRQNNERDNKTSNRNNSDTPES